MNPETKSPVSLGGSLWSKCLGTTAGVPRGDELAIIAYLREAQSAPELRDPVIMARYLQWPIERINAALAALVGARVIADENQLIEAWRTAPPVLKDPVGAARARRYRAKKRGNPPTPAMTRHDATTRRDAVMTRHAEALDNNHLAEPPTMTPLQPPDPNWVPIGRVFQRVGAHNATPHRTGAPGNPDKPYKEAKRNYAFEKEPRASAGAIPDIPWASPHAEHVLDRKKRR